MPIIGGLAPDRSGRGRGWRSRAPACRSANDAHVARWRTASAAQRVLVGREQRGVAREDLGVERHGVPLAGLDVDQLAARERPRGLELAAAEDAAADRPRSRGVAARPRRARARPARAGSPRARAPRRPPDAGARTRRAPAPRSSAPDGVVASSSSAIATSPARRRCTGEVRGGAAAAQHREPRGVPARDRDRRERERQLAVAVHLPSAAGSAHRGARVDEEVHHHLALGGEAPHEQRVEAAEQRSSRDGAGRRRARRRCAPRPRGPLGCGRPGKRRSPGRSPMRPRDVQAEPGSQRRRGERRRRAPAAVIAAAGRRPRARDRRPRPGRRPRSRRRSSARGGGWSAARATRSTSSSVTCGRPSSSARTLAPSSSAWPPRGLAPYATQRRTSGSPSGAGSVRRTRRGDVALDVRRHQHLAHQPLQRLDARGRRSAVEHRPHRRRLGAGGGARGCAPAPPATGSRAAP